MEIGQRGNSHGRDRNCIELWALTFSLNEMGNYWSDIIRFTLKKNHFISYVENRWEGAGRGGQKHIRRLMEYTKGDNGLCQCDGSRSDAK